MKITFDYGDRKKVIDVTDSIELEKVEKSELVEIISILYDRLKELTKE